MKKYIKVKNSGKGFITYADQLQAGLMFRCLPGDITEIIGDKNKIAIWTERVNGINTNEVEAMKIVNAKVKEAKIRRIEELKDELTILENEIK